VCTLQAAGSLNRALTALGGSAAAQDAALGALAADAAAAAAGQRERLSRSARTVALLGALRDELRGALEAADGGSGRRRAAGVRELMARVAALEAQLGEAQACVCMCVCVCVCGKVKDTCSSCRACGHPPRFLHGHRL
jgi:hypothetical protein